MKSIDLKYADNYPELVAHFDSNNFGDLIITLVKEHLDGTKDSEVFTYPEGNWPEYGSKPFLLCLAADAGLLG